MLKAGRPILAADGTSIYTETKEIEFNDYVYRPKNKDEFDAMKKRWEDQWGSYPNDGAGVALWEELNETVMPENDEEVAKKGVAVVSGVRSTTARGKMLKE